MNITTDTLSWLKNFSDINQNILVKPRNTIQTISTMKNILQNAEWTEKFDSEFAIYDLPEFLRTVELFEKPALKFNDQMQLYDPQIINNQLNISLLTNQLLLHQQNAINMPDQYVSFTLKKDDFARLQRTITTLNLPDVTVVGDKNIKLVATDKKNKSSNDYSEIIVKTDKKFNAYFKQKNLKIIVMTMMLQYLNKRLVIL